MISRLRHPKPHSPAKQEDRSQQRQYRRKHRSKQGHEICETPGSFKSLSSTFRCWYLPFSFTIGMVMRSPENLAVSTPPNRRPPELGLSHHVLQAMILMSLLSKSRSKSVGYVSCTCFPSCIGFVKSITDAKDSRVPIRFTRKTDADKIGLNLNYKIIKNRVP